MKGFRIRVRLKIYPVLWSGIILVSVYLLIRYAGLSFSEDSGQASLTDAAAARLCAGIINAGPSLITYTADDDNRNSILADMVGKSFALQDFIREDSVPAAYAQGYASLLKKYRPVTEITGFNAKDSDETAAAEDGADTSGSGAAEAGKEAAEAGNMSNSFGFRDILSEALGLEYVLTNGEIIRSETAGRLIWDEDLADGQLNIGYLEGDISPVAKENSAEAESTEAAVISGGRVIEYTMEQLRDTNFLVRNFYFVDGSTAVTESLFNADELVSKDMTIKQKNDAPQILIYHTHSQEDFADSRPGEEEDTVVGMGSYLAQLLKDQYGYNVIHDKTYYDVIGDRGYDDSYTMAEAGLKKILELNPTLEVMIDLHRNSGDNKVIMLNGEETAQVMMFNGLCRDQRGPLTNMDNPYLQDNLAFSLQLQLKSLELYPGLFRTNYLKSYRYNMHFRPKSLLVELGTENNTVQSAKNALEPFAKILDSVLQGDKAAVIAD